MIGNSQQIINWLFQKQDLKQEYEINERRKKRSLDQNSYAWQLITQIADVLRKSKEDVYLQMLEDYGQSMMIPVEHGKKPDGFFKYYKFFGEREISGKVADYYVVYKGSSDFDTKEMSIFIDGVVQEAQNLDIETMTPDELAKLKAMEQSYEKHKKQSV